MKGLWLLLPLNAFEYLFSTLYTATKDLSITIFIFAALKELFPHLLRFRRIHKQEGVFHRDVKNIVVGKQSNIVFEAAERGGFENVVVGKA